MGTIPAQVLSRHSWPSKRSLWRGHTGAIPWGSFTQPVPILTPMMLSMPTEPPSPGVVSCSGQERHRGSEVQGQDLWAGEHTEQPGISLPCTCSSHFVSYDCLFYFLFFYFEEVSHQLGKKKKRTKEYPMWHLKTENHLVAANPHNERTHLLLLYRASIFKFSFHKNMLHKKEKKASLFVI